MLYTDRDGRVWSWGTNPSSKTAHLHTYSVNSANLAVHRTLCMNTLSKRELLPIASSENTCKACLEKSSRLEKLNA